MIKEKEEKNKASPNVLKSNKSKYLYNFLPKSPGLTTTQAIELAKRKGYTVTRPTLIKWIQELSIGKKVFGRWYIDQDKFLWHLKYGND